MPNLALNDFTRIAGNLGMADNVTPLRVAGDHDVRDIGRFRNFFTFRSTYLAATHAFLTTLEQKFGDNIANMMKLQLAHELDGRKPQPLTAKKVFAIANEAQYLHDLLLDFANGQDTRTGRLIPEHSMDRALECWFAAHPASPPLTLEARRDLKAAILRQIKPDDLGQVRIDDASNLAHLFQLVSEGRVSPLSDGLGRMEIMAAELLNEDALRRELRRLPNSGGIALGDDAARLATEVRARVAEETAGLTRMPMFEDQCRATCMDCLEETLRAYVARRREVENSALPPAAKAQWCARLFTSPRAPAPSRLRSPESSAQMKQVTAFEFGVNPDTGELDRRNSLHAALHFWFAGHPIRALTEQNMAGLRQFLLAQLENATFFPNPAAMAAAVEKGRLSPMREVSAKVESLATDAAIRTGLQQAIREFGLDGRIDEALIQKLSAEVRARFWEVTWGGTYGFVNDEVWAAEFNSIMRLTMANCRDRLQAIDESELKQPELRDALQQQLFARGNRLISRDAFARMIRVARFDDDRDSGQNLDAAFAVWAAAHPIPDKAMARARAQVRNDLFDRPTLEDVPAFSEAVASGRCLPMREREIAMNKAADSVLSLEAMRTTLANLPDSLAIGDDLLKALAEEVRLRCSEQSEGFTRRDVPSSGETWAERLASIRDATLQEVVARHQQIHASRLPEAEQAAFMEAHLFVERDGRQRLINSEEMAQALTEAFRASEVQAFLTEVTAPVDDNPALRTALSETLAAQGLKLRPGLSLPAIKVQQLKANAEVSVSVRREVLEMLQERAAAAIRQRRQENPAMTPEEARALFQQTLTTWAADVKTLSEREPAALRLHWVTRACRDPLFGGPGYAERVEASTPAMPIELFGNLHQQTSRMGHSVAEVANFCRLAMSHVAEASQHLPDGRWISEKAVTYLGDALTVALAKSTIAPAEGGKPILDYRALQSLYKVLDGPAGKSFRALVQYETDEASGNADPDAGVIEDQRMATFKALHRTSGLQQGIALATVETGFNTYTRITEEEGMPMLVSAYLDERERLADAIARGKAEPPADGEEMWDDPARGGFSLETTRTARAHSWGNILTNVVAHKIRASV